MSRRNRTIMPVKGYYTRAKVFLYLMAAVIVFYALYSVFQVYFE